jgi:hypothetical protein
MVFLPLDSPVAGGFIVAHMFSIGEFSKIVGMTVKTLRFYDLQRESEELSHRNSDTRGGVTGFVSHAHRGVVPLMQRSPIDDKPHPPSHS